MYYINSFIPYVLFFDLPFFLATYLEEFSMLVHTDKLTAFNLTDGKHPQRRSAEIAKKVVIAKLASQ